MAEILEADSFVCNKKTDMQCAGHMLLNGDRNAFVRLASRVRIALHLNGAEQILKSVHRTPQELRRKE